MRHLTQPAPIGDALARPGQRLVPALPGDEGRSTTSAPVDLTPAGPPSRSRASFGNAREAVEHLFGLPQVAAQWAIVELAGDAGQFADCRTPPRAFRSDPTDPCRRPQLRYPDVQGQSAVKRQAVIVLGFRDVAALLPCECQQQVALEDIELGEEGRARTGAHHLDSWVDLRKAFGRPSRAKKGRGLDRQQHGPEDGW